MKRLLIIAAIALGGWLVTSTEAQQTFDLPFTADQFPNFDASKITSGVFAPARVGSGTGNTNRVLYWTSSGGEWKDPFEFPTTRSGRDVTASTHFLNLTTSTIATSTSGALSTITVSAVVKITQTNAGSCTVIFSHGNSTFGTTTITSSPGTVTMTVPTSTSVVALKRGNASPVTLHLRPGVTGVSCFVASGDATLTLTI